MTYTIKVNCKTIRAWHEVEQIVETYYFYLERQAMRARFNGKHIKSVEIYNQHGELVPVETLEKT